MEATPGFEPGIRALQAPALPLGHVAIWVGRLAPDIKEGRPQWARLAALRADLRSVDGADDRIRTGDPNLGKVVLYQLSHVRAQGVVYQGG